MTRPPLGADALRDIANTALADEAEYTTKRGTPTTDEHRHGRMLAREPELARGVISLLDQLAMRARCPHCDCRLADGFRAELEHHRPGCPNTPIGALPQRASAPPPAPSVIGAWLRRTARDALGIANGEGLNGIPGGMAHYDVRLGFWPFDRRPGYQTVISCVCTACGARRSGPLAVRRMAMHVERLHR